MNKYQFMYELNSELEKLGVSEISEIMDDYEEHFRIGAEEGRGVEEIVAQLGAPKEIARSYTDGEEIPEEEEALPEKNEQASVEYTPVKEERKDNTNKWIVGILLAIFVFFVVLPALGTIAGILIAMFVIALVFVIAPFGLMFTISAGGAMATIGMIVLTVGMILLGVGLALLAVWATWGTCKLCVKAWKAGVKLIKEA